MRKAASLFLALLFWMISSACPGQSAPRFSTPELFLQDGYLVIRYDILNGNPDNLYDIRVEITDSTGNPIQARSFTGDVGRDIPGGAGRTIRWTRVYTWRSSVS